MWGGGVLVGRGVEAEKENKQLRQDPPTAIDVFSVEPIRPDNPLVGAPNLFPTPHVAGRGKEGVVRSFRRALLEHKPN